MTFAYAGCRLSGALARTADPADLAAGVLVFENPQEVPNRDLSQRARIPCPPQYSQHGAWRAVHAVNRLQVFGGRRIWL
jgi:hypothetical protein